MCSEVTTTTVDNRHCITVVVQKKVEEGGKSAIFRVVRVACGACVRYHTIPTVDNTGGV